MANLPRNALSRFGIWILVATGFLGGAGLFLAGGGEDGPAPAPASTAGKPPASATIREPASARPAQTSRQLVSSAAIGRESVEEPAEDAPAEITKAFPSITKRVADWREFRPDNLTVEPWPDSRITFTRAALKEEGRFLTWIGRNPNLPGASLVTVATASGYDAVLVIPGANQVSYQVRGEQVVVTESNPGESGCATAPAQLPRPAPALSGQVYDALYAQGHEPAAADPDAKTVLAPLNVDVLFAYDEAALAKMTALRPNDPADALEGSLKALVETANLALNQSLVTAFNWRYVGLVQAPTYVRTGKLVDDLAVLKPGGALYDWVKASRYKYGADQIVLIVGGEADYGGIASATSQVAVPADYASAVIRYGSSALTIAHELAHNFGCRHDRAHVDVISVGVYGDPARDNDGFWCYGQMWDNPPPPRGFTGTTASSGDIMSYAAWPLPYFSNPNISIRVTGFMFGWPNDLDLGTHQLGLPEADPKAAYTARVLTDQAAAMSSLSEEIAALSITRQPQGVAVPRGQQLQLSVAASGGGLAYQWRKGGVPIAGATAPLYGKTADDTDAGSYSVVITNLTGSVTSAEAAVTVTAPVSAVSPGAGGGGGGGGAPSCWFHGLLGILIWIRFMTGKRSSRSGEMLRG